MFQNVKSTLSGYAKYRGEGHVAFVLHRIAGLATVIFLSLHIVTTSLVFFAPTWYDRAIQIFRNPLVMLAEIVMAFFVVYHGVNGLRIAYLDIFRPDLWTSAATRKATRSVFVITILLWLPALIIMGRSLLVHGLGLFGGE
jgi:succinate dehydrogenase / fumarate reductase cytochrome b subunit